MVRYLGWIANAALFTLCCFLVANTANAIIAALLSQSPEQAVVAGPHSGTLSRDWDDRQQITRRNLFHSAELSPKAGIPAAPADEDLKETELPLKLWGTIAAVDPSLSWASVEVTSGKGAILAVRIGDPIENKATVVGIERRRVVLLENGSRRSLSLDDDDDAANFPAAAAKRNKPPTRATTARAARRASAAARRKAAEKGESPVGNPSSIYSQARVVPQIDPETKQITGLQLSAIQAGSVFEQAGIENGEVITEIDGTPVSAYTDSTTLMTQLSSATGEVPVVTVDQDGNSHDRVIP